MSNIYIAIAAVCLLTVFLWSANALQSRRRRSVTSTTPLRSLSPSAAEKKTDYSNIFPPSLLDIRRPDQPGADGLPDYAALTGVPLPQPLEIDISQSKPRPYRPFRWQYHQTMSLTKMDSDYWLELDSSYAERIAHRQQLFREHGPMVLQSLPGSEAAAKELMEMCVQFLCARYPKSFRLEGGSIFHNSILNTRSDLQSTPPLMVLLAHIPEDFAIMLRGDDGLYSFRAGVICSSLGWHVGSKIGLKLHEIHEPIPDYKEKMQFSMDRYFSRLPCDKPIQRGSWGLEVDEPLFMPPGDPHEVLRGQQDPALTIDRCNLRVDWQTLRRLPGGAIIFNFKALFTPVAEFRDEPYIPSLLLKNLRAAKGSIMQYKGTWHTEHVVIPALEAYEREQIENGLMPKDWQPETLNEAPFFPGWEDKWSRQCCASPSS